MISTYKEAEHWLFHRIPNFQKYGPSAYSPGLSRMQALHAATCVEKPSFKIIHIAGTNGKGSTSHAIASGLDYYGYSVGLFTSPHFQEFTERIRTNKGQIPKEFVLQWIQKYCQTILDLDASFFEVTCCLALDYFEHTKCDVVILETGIGGRLDATNILPEKALTVITNIGLDHTDILGNTLEKIAAEKAGITRQNTPLILAQQSHSAVHQWYDEFCKQQNIPFFPVDALYAEESLNQSYLYRNTQTARLALQHFLPKHLIQGISLEEATHSLTNAFKIVGRWERCMVHQKRLILDMAHNNQGIQEVQQLIACETYHTLHILWSQVKGKDQDLFSYFPEAHIHIAALQTARALPYDSLDQRASQSGHPLCSMHKNGVRAALEQILTLTGPDDLILVVGSAYLITEAKEWLDCKTSESVS